MADIAWADVTSQPNSAALAAIATPWQDTILGYVNSQVNEKVLGHKARLAKILLASHYASLSLNNADNSAGPITSRKLAGKAVSYGSGGAFGMDLLAATGYGRDYLSLIRGASTAGMMVV